jgi:5'-nucleotidase
MRSHPHPTLSAVALATLLGATAAGGCGTVAVQILAINDFHGQISAGRRVGQRPVGSAAVVSSYWRVAAATREQHTVLVEAGDLVGASPASSALLRDEPTVAFFNAFANASCPTLPPVVSPPPPGHDHFAPLFDPRCNLVGIPGNHEFDAGSAELLRLLGGGNHASGPFLDDPWRGARFPVIAANIHTPDGGLLFRPYVIKIIDGEKLAFVGAVTRDLPNIVSAKGIAGLTVSDEATAINAQVQELHAAGIHAIVAVLHEGGTGQTTYDGPTRPGAMGLSSEITSIVHRLDADIDVVISAHSHAFANALVDNAGGRPVLVTQAFSAGSAYAAIDLTIDRRTHDVTAKSARIVTTWADAGPGLTPDAAMQALTLIAEKRVAPIASAVVATTAAVISRRQNEAGESPLGDLVAEAQRAAMGADFGIANAGGLRADIPSVCPTNPCTITWNDCFTAQPFSNAVTSMSLTGQQLYDVLEEQWLGQSVPRLLQIAGFTYAWSAAAPLGRKVVAGSVKKVDGTPVDRSAAYIVATNSFLSQGGDTFAAFKKGTGTMVGPLDLEALIASLAAAAPPFVPRIDGRIKKVP